MADTGPVGPSRRHDGVPRRHVGYRFGRLRLGQRIGRVGDHRQRAIQRPAQLVERDDAVDDPVPLQVLRGLDAGREWFAIEQLIHPGSEEADQSARFGDGDMSQRAPRREHPAGGRVAQVDQVGQVRPFVESDGRGDLHHLQKRDRALLHAGPAGARRGQQGQPLGGCPFHGGGDSFGRGHPDRAAEEVEFADHHRNATPEDAPLAGQHRFVPAGGGSSVGQLPRVGLGHLLGNRDCHRIAVPADERALVEHGIPQLFGRDTGHPMRLYRLDE